VKSLSAALLALSLLDGLPAYVFKACVGHVRLLRATRPIERVLQDPAVHEEVKSRLRLVEEVRRFGIETMGFSPGRSYTAYAEVPGAYVTLAVTACRKTAFEPYEWWFPFLGRLPYKGYFDPEDARREARRLEAEGYDVSFMEVAAYSTLGWTADPVLSTMMGYPPGRLAEIILHEMSHSAVYFKGRTEFNESAATFLGEAGAAEFIRGRFGEGSAQWREFSASRRRRRSRSRVLMALYGELSALYASGAGEERMLLLREKAFARARKALAWGAGRPLNNAVVLGHRRYHRETREFERLHESLGRDWKRTLQALKESKTLIE
jgi:predicted aminopeptidase